MSKITTLTNQLAVLGYTGFEISELIRSVTHGRTLHQLNHAALRHVTNVLEQYVRLGTDYVANYSK